MDGVPLLVGMAFRLQKLDATPGPSNAAMLQADVPGVELAKKSTRTLQEMAALLTTVIAVRILGQCSTLEDLT